MKNTKELNSILTNYLDEFTLSCSEKDLIDLKSDLIKYKERKDQIIYDSIQNKVAKIRKPYKNIATLFTSSNNQYMNNLMPELQSIGDIRYCVLIEKDYLNILNELYQTVLSSLSNSSPSEINKNGKMSLLVFKQILNSLLIVIDNIMSNSKLTPTKDEVEKYINDLLDEERNHSVYHLEDYKKEDMIDKYLVLLNELDNQSI